MSKRSIVSATLAAAALTVGAWLLGTAIAGGGSATAGALDTDGDGCPNSIEVTTQFDYLNQWDFFDPTGDNRHRVDDILAVMTAYGIDEDDGGYSTVMDRSADGPAPSDIGPPDGLTRIHDVFMTVNLYFQDCL